MKIETLKDFGRLIVAMATIGGGAALVAGCQTTQTPEPRIVIQEVTIPVPVSCLPKNLGPAPSYPDTDEALKQATPEGRYQLLIAGRGLRIGRLGEVEPAIEGCRQ